MKLNYLNHKFYRWAIANLVEIEHKQDRPYAMITIKIQDHLFAVPLRSNIDHPHCYVTAQNIGSNTVKGIDFSKSVIITSGDFDYARKVTISQDEFNALKGKERIIATQFIKYIADYKAIIQKQRNDEQLHNFEQRFMQYSTLQN